MPPPNGGQQPYDDDMPTTQMPPDDSHQPYDGDQPNTQMPLYGSQDDDQPTTLPLEPDGSPPQVGPDRT